jgi:hypothetical protein
MGSLCTKKPEPGKLWTKEGRKNRDAGNAGKWMKKKTSASCSDRYRVKSN